MNKYIVDQIINSHIAFKHLVGKNGNYRSNGQNYLHRQSMNKPVIYVGLK